MTNEGFLDDRPRDDRWADNGFIHGTFLSSLLPGGRRRRRDREREIPQRGDAAMKVSGSIEEKLENLYIRCRRSLADDLFLNWALPASFPIYRNAKRDKEQ